MGLGEAATISRAMADLSDIDMLEPALQFGHRQLEQVRSGVAADPQPPAPQIDALRNIGEVVANKEGVVRGDRLREEGDRSLVVRRAIRKFDERLLTGERVQDSRVVFATRQPERQIGALRGRSRPRRQPWNGEGQHATQPLQDSSAFEHVTLGSNSCTFASTTVARNRDAERFAVQYYFKQAAGCQFSADARRLPPTLFDVMSPG
jgi:hypothetical protein